MACPDGLAHFHIRHPDVPVYAAAVDCHVDSDGCIVPGLGDAGDRLFGTKQARPRPPHSEGKRQETATRLMAMAVEGS